MPWVRLYSYILEEIKFQLAHHLRRGSSKQNRNDANESIGLEIDPRRTLPCAHVFASHLTMGSSLAIVLPKLPIIPIADRVIIRY